MYSLLDDPLIGYRRLPDGQEVHAALPDLFVALQADAVRDFPALRPHQRHPWHAFLVHLAALLLHRSGGQAPDDASGWRQALRALTPAHADDAAWHLVTPPDRPALLQPAVPGEDVRRWKNVLHAADALDMLVTAKAHDLKPARMMRATPEDWLFALLSLQSQEGFLGAGNYGVSRMNGGFASRSALGLVPDGGWGRRWQRDVRALLETRQQTVDEQGCRAEGGLALVWLAPWDGNDSLSFAALDPHYLEICRRVRLVEQDGRLMARTTGSKAPRIAARERNGLTGDAWMPVDVAEAKALTVSASGFHYKLVAELLFGGKYRKTVAQQIRVSDGTGKLSMLAQAVTRGQGKTEGYHERQIPVSPGMRARLLGGQDGLLGRKAQRRVESIAAVRRLLWVALLLLFNNGEAGGRDEVKNRATRFAEGVERNEDARFFDDLAREIEAADPEAEYLDWLLGLEARTEQLLTDAFAAGPRSSMRRYRARSAALDSFRGALRGQKSPLPVLAEHYRQLAAQVGGNPRQKVSV